MPRGGPENSLGTADPLAARCRALELELEAERQRLSVLRRRNLALRESILKAPASSGSARALSQLAAAAYAGRDYQEAIEMLRTATEVEPENDRLWVLLARAHRVSGSLEAAQDAVERALELRSGGRAALREAAEIRARARDVKGLAEAVGRLGPLEDCSSRDLQEIVRWSELAGADQLMRRAVDLLLVRDGGSAATWVSEARLRWRAGDPQGARSLLGGASDAERADLIRLELFEGDPERALMLLEEMEDPDLTLLRRIAVVLRQHGHLRQAESVLIRVASSPDAPDGSHEEVERLSGELAVMADDWIAPAGPPSPYTAEPKRVLSLLGRSLPHVQSGYSVRSHYVMCAQREAGLDPIAATQIGFPDVAGARDLDEIDGVAYHRLSPGEPGPLRADRRMSANFEALDELVGRLKPAVLHPASDFLNARLALAVRERRGIPVVYEVRGFWEESWLARQPDERSAMDADSYCERRSTETACMLECDRIVTLAEVMRDQMIDRGVPADRITVIPNGVDPAAFPEVEPDPALARRLGLDGAELVLGYISSLVAYEGIEHLLRAAATLRARGRDVAVLIVGEGRERRRLQALAAELGLGDHAVFPGRVPHADVLAYYGLIDVFVVPRTADRVCQLVTPLKPFEALAVGRTLVVSDVTALREIVDEGRTGLTFRAEDADHLADVVEPLIDDPQRRRELAQAGREWVLAERTWSRNGERYRALFEELSDL